MKGGYRTPCDPRPLLSRLESETDVSTIWPELWDELHHQGDVDEASYAVVPHLVRIYLQRGVLDANVYSLVATIELARLKESNPNPPDYLANDYFAAIDELARIGLQDLQQADQEELVFGIMALIALWKGYRTWGYALLSFQDGELGELLEKGMQEYLTLLNHTLKKL